MTLLALTQAAVMLRCAPRAPQRQQNQGPQSWHKGPYQKSRRRQRRGVAQHPDARAAHRQLRIRTAGLCYDMPPVEQWRSQERCL